MVRIMIYSFIKIFHDKAILTAAANLPQLDEELTFFLGSKENWFNNILIGMCLPSVSSNHCSLIYIYFVFIFPPLRIPQYLDYIERVGVKRFVLVAIVLLVFLFTFRCTG